MAGGKAPTDGVERMVRSLGKKGLGLFGWLPPERKLAAVRRLRGFVDRFRKQPADVEGVPMYVPPRLYHWYVRRELEPVEREFVSGALVPGMRCVDVGANIGFFSLLMARLVGARGHVTAFEPGPANFRFLERNLALHGMDNVRALQLAAGSRQETRPLRVDRAGTKNSFFAGRGSRAVDVQVTTIDAAVERADFVKIDVEGAELEVLAGMDKTLASGCRSMLVEWNPRLLILAGHSPDALPRALARHGFALTVLDQIRDVEGVLEALERGSLEPNWYASLAATR